MIAVISKMSSKIPVDTAIGVNSVKIFDNSWAIPVKPLEKTFAGMRNKLSATAFRTAPIMTTIIFFVSSHSVSFETFDKLNDPFDLANSFPPSWTIL